VFQTATDIGEAGIDDIYGWGLLNVGNMVDTYSAEAGALYAQSVLSHAMTLDRVADTIDARPDQANPDRSGFWLTPFGSYADLSLGNSQFSGRYTTGGMMGGFDYAINDQWTFGAAIGFARNQFKSDSGNTSEDASYHAAPYIAFDNDAFFADAAVGASYFANKTRRVSAPGMTGTVLAASGLGLSSEQDDKALWATLRGGAHFDLGGVKASPYLFGRVARQYLDDVRESGTSILALKGNSTTATTGELGAGVKISGTAASFEGLLATPSLDLAYGRRMGDYSRTLDLLGNPVESEGNPNRNQFQVGADLLLTKPQSTFETKLSYRAELSADVVSHTVSANLGFKF
jgi:subtilase-type serine protease